jgi:hypothetical protein
MEMGSVETAQQKVAFPNNVNSMITWLEGLKLGSVTFVKTDNLIKTIPYKERAKLKNKNHIEAAMCAMIVDNFRQSGIDLRRQVSVITPFLE